jgi:hypothetical protein
VLESAGEEHDEAAPAEHALEELQARLAQAEIAPEVQAELSYIAEQLRRASEFDEFRPRVLPIHAALERLLGFAQAVQNAKWLKKEVRESLEAQLGRVASMLREPPTRQEAIAASATMATTAMIINRASQIVESEPRIQLLVSAWLEQPDRIREDSLKLLAAVLKRMAQYRQSDSPNLRRELRLVERDLDQAYREAESSLLDRMIAEKQPSLADPSFSTLVADHQQTLEDMHRVRQLPIWTQAIQGIDAQIAERFEKQATRFAKLLLDNSRRPDAIAAMDQFESQWSSFHRLAIEDALESPTPAVLEVTGGLHLELAAVIKATRREWARAWAEGETAGSAAKRMALLAQLGAAITSHASAQDQGQNVEMLNRWAAWQLGPDLPGRTSAEFSGRLKLATAAAAANDDAGLERQLQQLEQEAPVARLVMRLMSLVGERLGELPSGALGCAGKLQHAAPANAVLVEHRVMIAELCRALHEHQHAIESGSNRASEWNQYVESLSDALLDSMAPSRPLVSPISGLDVEN